MGRFQETFTQDQRRACAHAHVYDGMSSAAVVDRAQAGELLWRGVKLEAFSPSKASVLLWAKEEEQTQEEGMQRLKKRNLANAIPDDLARIEALVNRDIKQQETLARRGKQVNQDRLKKDVEILRAILATTRPAPVKPAPEKTDAPIEGEEEDNGLIGRLARMEQDSAGDDSQRLNGTAEGEGNDPTESPVTLAPFPDDASPTGVQPSV